MRGRSRSDGVHLAVSTAAERPDLWQDAEERFPVVWPEYNVHGDVADEYFSALYPQHADVQILVYDVEREHVVARGRAIPFPWDGTLEDLPAGIDAVGLRALEEAVVPTALSALAVEVVPDEQQRGLSGVVLRAMAQAARTAGLAPLIAPVRPTRKDQYPLIPSSSTAGGGATTGCPSTRGCGSTPVSVRGCSGRSLIR